MRVEWDYSGRVAAYTKRPGYAPEALVSCPVIRDLRPGARICDVGAGTGNLTVRLAASDRRVVALEPNAEMRAAGRARVGGRAFWVAGYAEEAPFPSSMFDLVAFGSSLNVTDTRRALLEAARVLRPGGGLVCVWNHRRLDDPWQRRIEEVIRRQVPSFEYGSRRSDPTPQIDATGCFGPVMPLEHPFVARRSTTDWLEAWRSHLTLARQAGARFGAVLEEIEDVLREVGDESLDVPYVTRLWFCRRRSPSASATTVAGADGGALSTGPDDEAKVKRWFETQPREIAAPATPASLAAIFARRPAFGDAEAALRRRALDARPVPLPPKELIDWVGGGGVHVFQTVGLQSFWQLLVYCGLRPGDRVLEPGCGCGRNARYLAPYLGPSGGYEGFDVHEPSIRWATENFTPSYPNVRFVHADIENSNYNPSGSLRDDDYVFPYASGAFDVVFLPSVFTHLTRAGFERYLGEIARVLVPGGLLLSWHFLLDETSRSLARAGRSVLPLREYDDVSWVIEEKNPCAAIAFDEPFVLEALDRVGLLPQFVAHGTWSGRVPDGLVDTQDRILAVRSHQSR